MIEAKRLKAMRRLFFWLKGYIGTCLVIYLVLASLGAFTTMSLSAYNPMEWNQVSRGAIGAIWTLVFCWGLWDYDNLTRDVK